MSVIKNPKTNKQTQTYTLATTKLLRSEILHTFDFIRGCKTVLSHPAWGVCGLRVAGKADSTHYFIWNIKRIGV